MTLHIKPGNFYVGNWLSEDVVTVLGSCISVTMWHERHKQFAFCHYLLVNCQENEVNIGRYGRLILPYMVRHFDRLKCEHEDVLVAIYGGAVSQKAESLSLNYQVGYRNSDFALEYLDGLDFSITNVDVGGTRGRKIIYDSVYNTCHHTLLPVIGGGT